LLKKYEYQQSIARTLEELSGHGLSLSAGTVTDGFQKLLPWGGLTIFIDQPEIPMDNNTAERGLRNPVVGRKIYYGSGSIWSAELAAALFTIFKTLKLWKINIHTWLLAYFHECALIGGVPPKNINKFLPWYMTDEQKTLFSQPPAYQAISK
jgi:hypothetical protein